MNSASMAAETTDAGLAELATSRASALFPEKFWLRDSEDDENDKKCPNPPRERDREVQQ
jgi:hypothetical protein